MNDPERLAAYWEAQGRLAPASELDAVCYPGAPPALNAYADWSQRRAVARLLRGVGSLRGTRALDVGCGTGRWSRVLHDRGADVVGADRSEAMVSVARSRSPGVSFAVMDMRSFAFDDGEFDLAIEVTALQHLPHADQAAAARGVVRAVRPGGWVVAVDVVGRADAFTAAHGTYPRPRSEWIALWHDAGADPVEVRGQDSGYPLLLARVARNRAAGAGESRRGRTGWRRRVLDGLVVASYATDWVASFVPASPGTHVAALYRVRGRHHPFEDPGKEIA